MIFSFIPAKARRACRIHERISRFLPKNREKALITAFQDGDQQAFARIDARYRKPIFKYVTQRVPDHASSEDVVQEIFVKAYRFRASFDPAYSFSTWLWTIARNTISDWLRKHGTALALTDSESQLGSELTLVDELPSPEPDAEAITEAIWERRSKRKLFMQWARKLTSLQRRVVWMRLFHQLSYEEIAKNLGTSLSAVKCAMYRARLVLSEESGLVLSLG